MTTAEANELAQLRIAEREGIDGAAERAAELAAARTDGGRRLVKACPKCDFTTIVANPGGMQRSQEPATDYRCRECGHAFDEPVEREARNNASVRGDCLAGKLDTMDPDDLVTDGGHEAAIELASLPYQCRNCQREETIYVNAERLDGERVVDAHNARLIQTYCDDCHRERTFVLATPEADAARDGHPIQAVRDMEAKRQGQQVRADGGREVGDSVELRNRRWMEQKLRACRFVDWDRYTVGDWDGEQYVTVYGWIDRDDSHEDFAAVIFWPESEGVYNLTSSAEHSEQLTELLHGETDGHSECRRVEDAFNVENAVMTDGGQSVGGTADDTLLRKGGIQQRMRCKGPVAHNIEDAFVTVGQLVAAVESDDPLTDIDGIGPKTAEVIEDWWENRVEREAQASRSTITRTSNSSATISFHQSWETALGIEIDAADGGKP
jgi:transposase-like protein